MKILHVIDSGGLYGAETMLLNLAAEQIRMGLTPILASIGTNGQPEKPVEKEAAKLGMAVRRFRMRPGPNYFGAFKILSFARAEKCDLLHSHGYKGNILLGLLPRPLRKIPMVSSLHGYTSTGGLTRMRMYEWLDSLSLRFIDRVVLVDSAMREHPRLSKLPVRFTVVRNGIPNQRIAENKKLDSDIVNFCSSGFVIGAIGRLSREKGYDVLLRAFQMATGQRSDLRLIIIGEGGERAKLEKMIEKFCFSETVMLAGFRADAKKYLSLMDTLVLSSFTEGLPLVALEGLQAGVPIVASRVGGLPELLEDGKAGIVIEKGNAEILSEAIIKIVEDTAFRKKIAAHGKNRVATTYSSRRMAEGYLKVYRDLTRI